MFIFFNTIQTPGTMREIKQYFEWMLPNTVHSEQHDKTVVFTGTKSYRYFMYTIELSIRQKVPPTPVDNWQQQMK